MNGLAFNVTDHYLNQWWQMYMMYMTSFGPNKEGLIMTYCCVSEYCAQHSNDKGSTQVRLWIRKTNFKRRCSHLEVKIFKTSFQD